MLNLILATEELVNNAPKGDDMATIAYLALGAAMLFAAIATIMVTPKAESHH